MFRQVDVDQLPPVKLVIGGASCVPFSRAGCQNTWGDKRSDLFRCTLHAIVQQARRNDTVLEAFLLEQVLGFADKPPNKDASPLQEVVQYLKEELGEGWSLSQWKMSTMMCGLPQARWRIYVGGRKASLFSTPAPRKSPEKALFQLLTLDCILDRSLPSDVHKLTDKMRDNLSRYKAKHSSEPKGTLIVCGLSTAEGKVRASCSRSDGLVPTLTTVNRYLFVFENGIDGTLHRFITNKERAMLQGWSDDDLLHMPEGDAAPMRILGNAMSLPCVGVAIAHLLSDRKTDS